MKNKIELLFKFLIVVISFIGIVLNINIFGFNKAILYFTVQSNILVFVFYLVITILMVLNKLKKNELYYILKGIVTMDILVTMVIYWLLMSGSSGAGAYLNHDIECLFVHLFTPSLVIADYLIFGLKGNVKNNHPLLWSLSPIVYIIFVIIYHILGGTFIDEARYPYEFMNIDSNGLMNVIKSCLVMYFSFLGFGQLIRIIDNGLIKK